MSDNEAAGYTLTRTYDAPRALVWRAISEGELFARWFGAEAEVEVHEWDLRPGGTWRATMRWGGGEMPWTGRFVEVREPERLVVLVSDAAEVSDTDEVLTYTLTEAGDGTELVVSQSGGNLTPEQYKEAGEGSASFLDELAKVLATLS
jgi:uncharacterized protein YndB with AHSA1/START domain